VVGGLIPDFFKDDTKTIEDKVFAKTVGKVAARRVGWMFDISERLREKLLELKEDFITLQLDLEKVVGYIEAAEQLADFEIIKVSEQPNCNCNKAVVLVGVYAVDSTTGFGWQYTFTKGRKGSKDKHTLVINSGYSNIYGQGENISSSGEAWLNEKVASLMPNIPYEKLQALAWAMAFSDDKWPYGSLEWFT